MVERIIEAVKNRENILIHSPGGTGKTYILKQIAEKCIEWKRKVSCTAPTGIAALGLSIKYLEKNVSGSTIHSWGGIGLGDAPVEKLLERVLKWPGSRAKWMTTDVLIMDETSMIGADLLDKLDYIARRVRRVAKPFGGIQLVMGGDFLQLPPVKEKWAFKSMVWDQLNFKHFSLHKPQRYPDVNWFHLLLRVRKAQHTPEDVKFLQTRVKAYEEWKKDIEGKKENTTIVKPTVLHSRKADVDLDNEIELNKLDGKNEVVFSAVDVFTPFSHHAKADYYLKTLDDAIPKSITLRVGAQVMLKANLDIDAGYVNGSRGVVIKLSPVLVVVKWMNGQTTDVAYHSWVQEDKDGKMIRSQIPLILAWALTVHKCQGSTLDYAICNLGPTVFCSGQAYVALSRVRSSDGLLIEVFYPKVIQADKEALQFAESIEEAEAMESAATVVDLEETDRGELEENEDVEIVYFMNFVGFSKPIKKTKEKYESIDANTLGDDFDFQERFDKIKTWRTSLATDANMPAYRILNNNTLTDICYYKPSSLEELSKIKGIGPEKVESYGLEILNMLKIAQKRRLGKNTAD